MTYSEDQVRSIIESLPDHQEGVALDIGANFGIYTDLLASKFAWVYAFEPNSQAITKLIENVKSKNVTFVQKAIGIADGTWVKLYHSRTQGPGCSSTNQELPRFGGWGHSWDNYEMVESITLDGIDTIIKPIIMNNIKFIKCDIEAGEDYIFEYGRQLLKNNMLTMILEAHQAVNFERLYQLFKDCGYKVYTIEKTLVENMTPGNHYIITNEEKNEQLHL